jgi:serine/threonine protein kinase
LTIDTKYQKVVVQYTLISFAAFQVMLDARGFVKLVDFGLAKENVQLAFDDPVSPCGSAMYVAPEVLGFQGGFMIDWWSLGVLVYELLTGSPPWNTKVRRLIGKKYQWNSSGKRIEMLPPFTNLTG